MTLLNFRFEFDKAVELEQTSRTIQAHIDQLHLVEETQVFTEKIRITGAEIAAAIGVAVLVARGSRELIQEVRKIITEMKGLTKDLQGLKNIYIDVAGEKVPVDGLSEEHIQKL